jgi:uncharacterized membrane protein
MANPNTQLKTIVGLYDDLNDARNAVQELSQAGIQRDNINLVAHASAEEYSRYFDKEGRYVSSDDNVDSSASGAAAGAGVGAIIGALGGLVLGLSLIPIPGIGPIVAAGPLASALTGAGVGAVVGGLIGALTGIGVPEEHAGYYAEGVRRGGSLVIVKTDATMLDRVSSILNRHNPVDVEQRVTTWRSSGWSGFDSSAKPYNTDMIAQERASYGTARGNASSRYF